MEDNELLYVLFSPEFLEDIETLGNSIIVSHYYIEDYRGTLRDINSLLLDNTDGIVKYNSTEISLYGYWDDDTKLLKVHLSLFKNTYSNKVKEIPNNDPEIFELESLDNLGRHDGNGLVRIFRFIYKNNKTAFIVTGNISSSNGEYIIDPIICNQDKILITIGFPPTTKANIQALKEEKDTWFLEGPGILKGINVYKTYSDTTLASRYSTLSFLKTNASEIRFDKKEVPYIGNDGRNIYRRDRFRLYTRVDIYCSNLITNILPKTRASLNMEGGILKIHGTLEYLEYEIRGTEFIYIGNGSEALDGVPDTELILDTHENGLIEPTVNGLYISYGKYDEQPDPSVLVKARVRFYNLFTNQVEFIESEKIRLTQEVNVISQWEVISRSTNYTEPTSSGNIPVYMFPWQAGRTHTFTIRTTLPNLNIEDDFSIEYSDQILDDYFNITIRPRTVQYPITDYVVNISSKQDNLNTDKWFPIINGESELLLTTIRLLGYDYTESFYLVQSPKVPEIELHDVNNNNIEEISLDYNQVNAEFYPVAPEAQELSEIGDINSWVVIDHDSRVEIEDTHGLLNPNNNSYLDHKLSIVVREEPSSISNLDLGKIILGRVKELESSYSFSDQEWRNLIGLSKVMIPIQKLGTVRTIETRTETLTLDEIDLYEIRVVCNGPFACWMRESSDYCFFDPSANLPTYTNYFYSRNFNNVDGVLIYLALHHTEATNEDPEEDNTVLFTVVSPEPSWNGTTRPDCFNDPENLASCTIFRKKVDNPIVDYINLKDAYVFLGGYEEENKLRFISTETPLSRRLQTLENSGPYTQQQYYYYHNIILNDINITDPITPEYTVPSGYMYHTQGIQNPNTLYGYYPISPSYLYEVYSCNHPDINCSFFLFRKALPPNFYIASDSPTNNIVYVTANPNGSTNNSKTIIIRSRYEIPQDEFRTVVEVGRSFTVETSHEIISTSDHQHKYTITINPILSNPGGQRSLGKITITSKIDRLVNFVSSEHEYITMPNIEFTQDEIDEIAPPASMEISIIQEGTGFENPDEIEVNGDRNSISSAGEIRIYNIDSSIPIDTPQIQGCENCTVNIDGMEKFSVNVPPRMDSIYSEYAPLIPSETSIYTSFVNKRQVRFYLRINSEVLDYKTYSETFSFLQNGLSKGLIFAVPGEVPKLYLGPNNSINLDVSSQTTSLNVFLGVFGLSEKLDDGSQGTTKGMTINPSSSYRILNETPTYQSTSNWSSSVSLQFPENTTDKTINRNFTIICYDNGTTHKISIVVNQFSGNGSIICDDSAYFASSGDCLDNTNGDLGSFRFETNIDINNLSLNIPDSLYDSYSFTYVGPSNTRSGYKIYYANIKLKPNLSNSTIKKQIFSFVKNKERIKNVWIKQGYYCLKLCEPGQTDVGVYSGGILGSLENPYVVPSRDNENYNPSDRKLFNLTLERSEPIPTTGEFTHEVINLDDNSVRFPSIGSFTWTYINSQDYSNNTTNSREDEESPNTTNNVDKETQTSPGSYSMRSFLERYSTEIHEAGFVTTRTGTGPQISLNYPYLENVYSVKSTYFRTSILFKVNVSIVVDYPNNDPLYTSYKRKTTHSYTIYLLKRAE